MQQQETTFNLRLLKIFSSSVEFILHPNPSNSGHVCGTGFKHLTPVGEALQIVLSNLPKKPVIVETVPVQDALTRFLAQDLISPIDVPPFDRAAMDGFAIIAEDTYGATMAAPVFLRTVGSVQIGTAPRVSVARGQATSIVTGAQMPQGANAVVMLEYTKQHEDGTVEVSDEVHPAENVARAGEDMRQGTLVLKKGTRLLPQDLGMLTYLGLIEVPVMRKPRVAVLSTGNELFDKPTKTPGKIPDVNRPTLIGALRDLGCEPVDLGIVPDEFDHVRSMLEQAVRVADMILVTAGTSVGPGDIVPKVIDSIGEPGMLVHGVAMRPSMPTGLAVVDGKPIVSLPGYPVSAYIAFLEFVPPLLSHILGTNFLPRPKVKARLSRRVVGILGSRTYVRVLAVQTDEGCVAHPVRTSGAGILSSLVQANGFVIVPEHVEGYEEGHEIEVELFRPLEDARIVR
jgi:molybdenum cofactor synthesis domain-containing protein